MKVYAIQSKNGIIINVCVIVKKYIIGIIVEMTICGILTSEAMNVIKHVKLMNIMILKIALVKNV